MTSGAYVGAGVAARWLGFSRRTIVRWVQAGKLAGCRVCATAHASDEGCAGCRYYVYREPLLERLAAARQSGASHVETPEIGDGNGQQKEGGNLEVG